MSWLSRLANVVRSNRLDRDLQEEQRFHLEARIAQFVKEGMTLAQAELEAARRFGNPLLLREDSRDIKLWPSLERVIQDIRYAIRGLRRSPIFTLAAVVTLALGIGANTAMFSVVNGVILRPLPYHDASRVLLLWTHDIKRGLHFEATAYPTVADWRRLATTFEGAARDNLFTLGTRERRAFSLLGTPVDRRWATARGCIRRGSARRLVAHFRAANLDP